MNSTLPRHFTGKEVSLLVGDEVYNNSGMNFKAKILVVAGCSDQRQTLQNALTPCYQVIMAADGKAALAAIKLNRPDVILSDMDMPDMNGLDLCKRVKMDIEINQTAYILLNTGFMVEQQIESLMAGADDYLSKPFNPELFTLKVRNLLGNRRKNEQENRFNSKACELIPESPDQKLLKKVQGFIEEKLSDPELSNERISDRIGLSRAQLYRKMKNLTGMSVVELIKEVRLSRACVLLKDRKFNVNEVTYMVGFNNMRYFRQCFKDRYGLSPSEFSKTNTADF